VTERSDLSQLTMCRPPQAGRTARVLCQNHWRGPRSVGARYKLRKVVCMEQSPPFRRINLFTVGHWHPPPPELVASTFSWAAVAYHAAALLTPLALTAGLGPALAIAARNKRTTPSVESVTGVIFYSPGQLMTQVGAVTPLAVRPSLFKRQQRD